MQTGKEGGTWCLAGTQPACTSTATGCASLRRCCQARVHMALLPFRKRERKWRRRKKGYDTPETSAPEADEGVPSLADPVAGTPVLTMERALAGFYFITFFYLTLPYFIIFFKCHRGRRPQQGCRALVPGPCWPVPPGAAGTWSGPGSRESPGTRGTAPTARAGRERGRSFSREGSPGLGCCRLCPPRTPPAHSRTLPAARRAAVISPGPGSGRHGMQRERGAPQPHVSPLRRATAGTADRGRGCFWSLPRATSLHGKPQAPAQLLGWSH